MCNLHICYKNTDLNVVFFTQIFHVSNNANLIFAHQDSLLETTNQGAGKDADLLHDLTTWDWDFCDSRSAWTHTRTTLTEPVSSAVEGAWCVNTWALLKVAATCQGCPGPRGRMRAQRPWTTCRLAWGQSPMFLEQPALPSPARPSPSPSPCVTPCVAVAHLCLLDTAAPAHCPPPMAPPNTASQPSISIPAWSCSVSFHLDSIFLFSFYPGFLLLFCFMKKKTEELHWGQYHVSIPYV